jgi:excisionase family DNA binding protein
MSRVIIDKDFYTTTELAKELGISKVSVLKRIWRDNIKASKMGRDFIIFKKDVDIKKLSSDIQGRLS